MLGFIEGEIMTLILELTPEVEAQLKEKARRHGLEPSAYLIELVMRDEPTEPVILSADRQERNAQIRALLQAPRAVVEATLQNGAAVMAPYYEQSLVENGELTEMTAALQGEPFDDAE